jgi:tetratricopeptide (TPR) repeat protein
MSRSGEFVSIHMRRIAIIAGALALAVVLSVGYYLYKGSVEKKAKGFLNQGYKYYHGLYDAEPLVKTDRLNRALDSFRKSNETEDSPISLYYMAACYYALGRYDEARAPLDELKRRFPADGRLIPLAQYKTAMLDIKAGKLEDALGSLEEISTYNTASYKDLALVESARILDSLGRKEEAVEKYRAIAERFPESPFMEEARLRAGIKKDEDKYEGKEKETGREGEG